MHLALKNWGLVARCWPYVCGPRSLGGPTNPWRRLWRDLVCAREQFRVRSSRRQVVLGDFTNRFFEVPVFLVVCARLTCGLACVFAVGYLATMVIVSVGDLLDLLLGDRREVLLWRLPLWLLLLSQEFRDAGVLWQRLLS